MSLVDGERSRRSRSPPRLTRRGHECPLSVRSVAEAPCLRSLHRRWPGHSCPGMALVPGIFLRRQECRRHYHRYSPRLLVAGARWYLPRLASPVADENVRSPCSYRWPGHSCPATARVSPVQNHLERLAFAEQAESLVDVRERHSMCHERHGIDGAAGDHLEELVMHFRLIRSDAMHA